MSAQTHKEQKNWTCATNLCVKHKSRTAALSAERTNTSHLLQRTNDPIIRLKDGEADTDREHKESNFLTRSD